MNATPRTKTVPVPTLGVPAAPPLPEDLEALLHRLRLPHIRARAGARVVVQDRGEVPMSEPGVDRCMPQRPVDFGRAEQLGQRDGLSHLDAHLCRARGGGLGQPQPGAVAQHQERGLGLVAGLGDSP